MSLRERVLTWVIGGGTALAPLIVLIVLAAVLSRRSKGGWKLLAWGPPIPLAVWWIDFTIDYRHNPTSHNLWPLEMIAWAALSCGLLVAFLIVRRVFSNPKRRPSDH